MAIIPLPSICYLTTRFDPVRPRDMVMMEDRRTESTVANEPYWEAEYASNTLKLEKIGESDAFIMKMFDGDYFLAHDTSRPRPIAYLSGQPGAFNGQGTLNSVTNPRLIVVGGLPVGYTLAVGDYLEVRASDVKRSLHRVTAPVVAGAGGTASVAILHPLNIQHFGAGDVVNFERASCVMQIDEQSTGRAKGQRGITFTAAEVFPYES